MSIVVDRLTKKYGKGETEVIALNEVSLTFGEGELCAITGTSGSGKTTLLHMLGGLDTPTQGKVLYDAIDIYSLDDRRLSEIRRKHCGFVFQFFNLIPELTAEENIILPMLLDNRSVDRKYIKKLSDLLGITDRLSHYPSQMSGGQQQRVAIARALSNAPEILLCDEPTGNLDEKTGRDVLDLLTEVNKEFGKTIVIVTHDPGVAKRCSRIIEIIDGKI